MIIERRNRQINYPTSHQVHLQNVIIEHKSNKISLSVRVNLFPINHSKILLFAVLFSRYLA